MRGDQLQNRSSSAGAPSPENVEESEIFLGDSTKEFNETNSELTRNAQSGFNSRGETSTKPTKIVGRINPYEYGEVDVDFKWFWQNKL